MSTVRLSKKSASAVVTHLEHIRTKAPELLGALVQLRDGLAPRRRKPVAPALRHAKPSKADRAKAKVEKQTAHRDETSAIYASVSARAAGCCEACLDPFTSMDPPELDHQAGRGRAPQTVENCWLIHARSCHRKKTNPSGGVRLHLELFIAHAEKHGYRAEAERARARLEGIVAVREFEKSKAYHEGQPPHGSTSPASEVRSGHEEGAGRGARSDSSVRAARPHASRTGERPPGAQAQSPSGQPQSREVSRGQ